MNTSTPLRWSAALLCLAALFLPHTAGAWDPNGHEVIALIAEKHLTAHARDAVAELLRSDADMDLRAASTWLDNARPYRPDTANWHFTDIPIADDQYVAARDCPRNDCAVAQIPRLQAILAAPGPRSPEKVEALKALIHIAGDIHQPLHSADRNDRGGNDLKVRFFGELTDLHRTWDTLLLRKTMHADYPNEYADKLAARMSPQDIARCSQGGPIDWTNEAYRLAKTVAYRLPAGTEPPIGDIYFQRAAPALEQQLQCGGVRAAKVLNEALR